jgi:calcineurin-like phosphoesterase
MRQQIDCPLAYSRAFMEENKLGETYDALLVDIHAEATAEKAVVAYLWDGHATLVVGTHTHIPTSDHRIQQGGTAFQTDAGMCGDYRSSLGMTLESVLAKSERQGRMAMQAATGEATLCGVFVTAGENGLATSVKAVRYGPVLENTL